jgi:serine/alanine adding enzyme
MLVNVVYKTNPDIDVFDGFVKRHPMGSMFQMSGWANIKREWDFLRLVGESDGEIVCAAQILIRVFPFGVKLFYIPRGPLCTNEKIARDFFQYIKQTAKKYGAFCVKFDPNQVYRKYDQHGQMLEEHPELIDQVLLLDKAVVHKGFDKPLSAYAQPRYNAVVLASDDMVEHFSSSTKRNIKTARKKNVMIDRYSREKLDSFARLMDMTEQRKGVSLRNREYFQRFFDAFEDSCHLFMANLNLKESLIECEASITALKKALENVVVESNQVKQQRIQMEALLREYDFLNSKRDEYGEMTDIGGLLVLIHKDTCEFLYSGMNVEFSKVYPAYLMRLKAMEFARSLGCVHLNFGGIPGSLDDGLWEFKRSFGSQVVEYVGEFDLIIRPGIYTLFEKGLPLGKKAMRKLKQLGK